MTALGYRFTISSMVSHTILIRGPEERQSKPMPILVDGGPLCIAGVWNWSENCTVHGLYFIYHKLSGYHFGPFYASLLLADKGMRKALKDIPKDVWSHPIEWYQSQQWLGKYIWEQMGKPEDLVGGEWAKT